jgi:phosphonate transport system substrate-binding protein
MAITRLFAALLFLTACSSGVRAADWRETLGTFRIGMVATAGGGGSVEGADAIRAGFAAALGMPVEIFAARDYAVLVDAQATGRIQYAVHTATSYASVSLLCSCVEPLAAPVGSDGSTGLRSVLVSRAGGPTTPAGAKAGRIAIGPADSVAGRLIPLAQFHPDGADLTGDETFLVPVASEAEAEAKLRAGDVDALFGFVLSDGIGASHGGTPARLADSGYSGAAVIWTSELLRNGPHAVGTHLPPEAKQVLKDFLLGLHANDPKLYDLLERRFLGGFAAVSHEDYASAISLVRGSARAAN